MKQIYMYAIGAFMIILTLVFINLSKKELKTNVINGTIISKSNNKTTIQDNENIIYTFNENIVNANIGDNIILNYTGTLNKNTELQNNEIVDYELSDLSAFEPSENDIFSSYYKKASDKLSTLSLEEKIGQLFLVRYNNDKAQEAVSNYKVSGFVFYENDFKDKTANEVIDMINKVQNIAKIGLLTSVDEEGGKIVRISSNPNLVNNPFKSSKELYDEGGLSLIKQDTLAKSAILKSLGLNLNLAPVVDVSTDSNAYIYQRTLGKSTSLTADYAKTVIEASKNTGVSYTLKHFPGYGNNTDTHVAQAIDTRSYDDILNNDLPPFKSGIEAQAEAVLVSHNIVSSIDSNNPASLSPSIHNLLRNELKFTGVVITDDLDMKATSSINDKYTKALLAGNDLIITTNYEDGINDIKNSLNNNTISITSIDKAALKVLAWKYYKGLIIENEK